MIDEQKFRDRLRRRLKLQGDQRKPDASLKFASASAPVLEACVGQTLSLTPLKTGTPLAAIVRKISAHALCLQLPWPEFGSQLRVGDFLQIEYWDQRTAFSFDSQIVLLDSAGKKLEISRPKKGKASRLKKARLHKSIPFAFTVIDATNKDLIGQQVGDVKALDISPDGLRFETDLPLTLSDKLEITLSLPEKTCALGWVIRQEPTKGHAGPPFSLAVKFARLEPKDHNRLMLFQAKTRTDKAEREIFWVD
ncbi:MAG: hypothetical protein ACE5MK_07310 [Acidobacteriota bacterium]